MKYITRAKRAGRLLVRVLGLSALGSITLAGLVAFRHILATPQPLESPLPGEAHLYRWKHGHIFYKVLGEPDAPSMVLLHTPELAASAYEWTGIMAALAARFRVYAPDLLGFGLSDRPGIRYTADIYTQLVHDFLTQVVGEPAILVASQLACNYAIAVAANSSDLCAGLVLLSPTAISRTTAANADRQATTRVRPYGEARRIQALIYPVLCEIRSLSRRFRKGRWAQEMMPEYLFATTHQFGAEHAPMAWLAGNLWRDVSAEIEKLQQAALIIWGTGELQQARQERNTSWGSEHTQMVLLQQTASAVHEELPESVAKTILQWRDGAIKQTDAINMAPPREAKASTLHNAGGTGGASGSPELQVKQANGESVASRTVRPQVEAYCMKCKEKRVMLNAREITMKNGRIAVQGACAVCGSQLFRMGRLVPGYPQTPV